MRQPRRHHPDRRHPERHRPDPSLGAGAPTPQAPRRRSQLLALYGLAAVLVAISLWCFVILGRTESLRSDLARHMGWLDQAAELRHAIDADDDIMQGALDDPNLDIRHGEGTGDTDGGTKPTSQLSTQRVQRLAAATGRLIDGHGAPKLEVAAERLEQRLADLAALIELSAEGEAGYEDVSEASYEVLKVLPGIETQVQSHVVALYTGLDRLWTSLRTLVLLCLVLCASNLGLLYLVHRRREQLEIAHARAVALASHDALTGAWNRGAILRILRLELSRAERSGRPLGVILLDLDDFRKLNVLLGSHEADHVLQEVSRRLATFVRPYDTLGRLGGDSFLVILPSCDATATTGVVERLSHAIEGEDVEHAHGAVQVCATLVHETLTHDPEDEETEGVDPDLLVHGMQLRIEESRRR